MKPKRRSTFSPSVETTLRSPRPKRRRLDSSSPTPRISSNSSEDVKPPPEFMPFPYEKICPKFHDLLSKNSDDITLERDDLLCLQHELERMLAHSADYLRRAHGEVTYLSTGDYPVQDLRARPMPSYKLREFAPISPSTTHELQESLCGLPEDDVDDDLDVWPPQHIPQRFWTWCKADFLTPIDAEYLRDFKALLIDKYSPEEMKHYYVNEPWKHRKRQHGRPRINTADVSNSRPRRKSSTDGNLLERKNKDKDEKKASGLTSSRASRGTDLKLTPLINDLVCAANRETRKDDSITPSRRSSVRLQSRDDCEEERKISVKSELSEVMGCDNISDPHDNSHINGLDSRSPLNTRLHSPRIKKESREEANQDWDRPGPSNSFGTNVSNGRFNGELKTKLKRNGEMKRENGFHSNTTKLDSPTSTAMSIIQEDGEIEQHYREIGGRIVKMLVDRGLIPSSTEHVYREIAQTSAHREINISQEGKEQDDDSDLDEVSQELLRCQTELQELEPRLRGVISHCWSKVCGDFAYWETMRQLDDADNDLFQLGMNLYHEHPSRRVPTNTELPTLRTALCRRNRKARQHYGPMYKRLRKYRKYRLNSVEEIPPPLKEQVESITNSSVGSETVTSLFTRLNVTITTVPEQKSHRTIDISQHTINVSAVPAKLAVLLSSNRSGPAISQLNVSAPSVGAPEFEDRNEPDEGGKGEEDIITNVDDEANVSPPADDEAVGEGIAKEDTEPLKGKERDENQLGAMVEDAKGNAAALHTRSQLQPHIDFVQSDDSHFMMYVVLSGMLLFCFYLLYHNKKKILGLMFEGRASHHPRRSVRYRRLSQREERDKQDLAK